MPGDDVSGAAASKKKTQSDKVLEVALARWALGRSTTNELFAIDSLGPNVARWLHDLKPVISAEYFAQHRTAPGAAALTDAFKVLEGLAGQEPPRRLGLRTARTDEGIVVDIGDDTGRAIVITPDGWDVVFTSPVLFRRSALTAPQAHPVPGGDLDELREFVNLDDDQWGLLVGVLVAAYIEDMPHPIVLLTGEQGAGKTTAAKMIVSLIDPNPAPVCAPPKDPEEWAVTAYASWVVGIDNLSHVPAWLSDSLCRAATGDALKRRRLYSDNEIVVVEMRRQIILTSIDAGALRGDLADRIVSLELQRIPPGRRREEAAILDGFALARPRILGALLDLVADVLGGYATIDIPELGRMADFELVLGAVDDLLGTDALSVYRAAGQALTADVVESDPVARAIRSLAESEGQWKGSSAELLERITPENPPRHWPPDATRLSGALRRATPALRAVGVDIDTGKTHGRRWVRITHAPSVPLLAVDSDPRGDGAGSDTATRSEP